MHRLMVAQGDIFMGTGDATGRMRDQGRMLVLLPIQRAYALAPEGL